MAQNCKFQSVCVYIKSLLYFKFALDKVLFSSSPEKIMTLKESSEDPVIDMFNDISFTYDKTNRLLSFGIDRYWRKQMRLFLPKQDPIHLIDCATGTGDQLIALLKKEKRISQAVGVDPAKEMLQLAQQKLKQKSYGKKVIFKQTHVKLLPFEEETFDCATISFGVRNFDDLNISLNEIKRVLKKSGKLLILEFSVPTHPLIKKLYLFYLREILPRLGAWISKNKHAYSYLQETIEEFPSGEHFCSILNDRGFKNVRAHPLTFGIVTIYQGEK